MTPNETLKQLKALGNEATRSHNARWGAGDNQFAVKHGDIRALAKKINADHTLAMSLWETGNIDAQYLAILLIKPKDLSAIEVDRLVRSVTFGWVADWLTNYVVKQHPDKETLRQEWMATDDRWAARAGWQLTAGRVANTGMNGPLVRSPGCGSVNPILGEQEKSEIRSTKFERQTAILDSGLPFGFRASNFGFLTIAGAPCGRSP